MRRVAMRIAGTFVTIMALAALGTPAAQADAFLDGFWMDSHGEVILEIGKCGDARCGRVAWLRLPNGPDGKPILDYRNPDDKLKTRPVCGLEVITDFRKQPDGTWGGGSVYVSDLGSAFSGYAEILNPTQVNVRGYVLIPLFGQSEVWSKVTKPFKHCLGDDPAKRPFPWAGRKSTTAGADTSAKNQ
jgi:uncharacterized protein (DUF2147 family)